jgi:hypothetical protein
MSRPLHNDALSRLPRVGPTWSIWIWLALAGALVIAIVFACLHVGRAFWDVTSTATRAALGVHA